MREQAPGKLSAPAPVPSHATELARSNQVDVDAKCGHTTAARPSSARQDRKIAAHTTCCPGWTPSALESCGCECTAESQRRSATMRAISERCGRAVARARRSRENRRVRVTADSRRRAAGRRQDAPRFVEPQRLPAHPALGDELTDQESIGHAVSLPPAPLGPGQPEESGRDLYRMHCRTSVSGRSTPQWECVSISPLAMAR